MDPLDALRPGDPVERLIRERAVELECERRDAEIEATVRTQSILTGQVTALCLGAPAEWVAKVGEAMLGGEQDEHR